jgi:hypothetical protein
MSDTERDRDVEETREELEAAAEAAAIGGRAGDEDLDPSERPLAEAGEGAAEGFEQAERELIEHASHGDEQGAHAVLHDEIDEREPEPDRADAEADHEHSADGEQDR